MASGKIERLKNEILGTDDAFDGVYLKNPTQNAGSITFSRLRRSGNVVFMSVHMVVNGPINEKSMTTLFYVDMSIRPAAAIRGVAIASGTAGTVGIISIAQSDGQISFAPSEAIAEGGSRGIRFSFTYIVA